MAEDCLFPEKEAIERAGVEEQDVAHTIVVFGSTRIPEPAAAQREVDMLSHAVAARPDDARLRSRLNTARRILGAVETVLSRGKVIIQDNQYKGRPGEGRFIKRGQCATA